MDHAAMTGDVLLGDLLSACGHYMAHALNSLQQETREAVGDALARGGEVELRIAAGQPSRVTVCVVNRNGEAAEVLRVLCASIDDMH